VKSRNAWLPFVCGHEIAEQRRVVEPCWVQLCMGSLQYCWKEALARADFFNIPARSGPGSFDVEAVDEDCHPLT